MKTYFVSYVIGKGTHNFFGNCILEVDKLDAKAIELLERDIKEKTLSWITITDPPVHILFFHELGE